MNHLTVEECRRPRVEVRLVTCWDDGTTGNSAATLTLTRAGVEVSGWYDSFVGLETGSLSWAEFDALRERLAPKRKVLA